MRKIGLLLSVPVAFSFAMACANREPAPLEKVETAPVDANVLGEFTVTVDTVRGTVDFKPIGVPDVVGESGLKVKNFQQVAKGNIKFTTPFAQNGANATNPPGLSSPRSDAAGCGTNQFCAQITAQNLSGAAIDNMFVEVTNITSATVAGKGDRDAGVVDAEYIQSPTGSQSNTNYVSFTNGAYWYGNVANNNAASRNWVFNTSAGATFNFTVRVLGTFQRTSVTGADAGTSLTTIYNACTPTNVSSATTLSLSVPSGTGYSNLTALDDGTATFKLPFPLTMYGKTDSNVWVNVNGLLGLGTTTYVAWDNGTANLPATGTTDAKDIVGSPAVMAFWDDLMLDPSTGKICWGLANNLASGAPRVAVVTWQDVGFFRTSTTTDGTTMGFSVLLTEFSDKAEIQYINPTAVGTTPSSGSNQPRARGEQATLGMQGGNSATSSAVTISLNTQFLPQKNDAKFPLKISLTPNADPAPCTGSGSTDGGC